MVKDTAATPEGAKTAKPAEAAESAPKAKKKAVKVDHSLDEAKAKSKEWTMARLAKVARRFDSEDAWMHGAPSSYKAAHSKGLVAQCLGHGVNGKKPALRGIRHSA